MPIEYQDENTMRISMKLGIKQSQGYQSYPFFLVLSKSKESKEELSIKMEVSGEGEILRRATNTVERALMKILKETDIEYKKDFTRKDDISDRETCSFAIQGKDNVKTLIGALEEKYGDKMGEEEGDKRVYYSLCVKYLSLADANPDVQAVAQQRLQEAKKRFLLAEKAKFFLFFSGIKGKAKSPVRSPIDLSKKIESKEKSQPIKDNAVKKGA